MSKRSDYIKELSTDIRREVRQEDWKSVADTLSCLAEQLVTALMDRNDVLIRSAYESVERSHSLLVTRDCPEGDLWSPETAASEMRAFTRLLNIALGYRRSNRS